MSRAVKAMTGLTSGPRKVSVKMSLRKNRDIETLRPLALPVLSHFLINDGGRSHGTTREQIEGEAAEERHLKMK